MTFDPTVEITQIGGNCPVQAEGTINGHLFYFRARHAHWSIGVGGDDPCGEPEWYYTEPYGTTHEAGWMEEDEARAFITKAAALFAATQRGMTGDI